jgi:GNAT superfamily N-acetyltransferase
VTNRAEVLAQFDREMRISPDPWDGVSVERAGPVVRLVGKENMIIYSALDATNARAVVAEEAAHFRAKGVEVEWKHFGHDRPANLPELLAEAGFVPDEPETLVVYDLSRGTPGSAPGPGIAIRPVETPQQLDDARDANRRAFPEEEPAPLERWRAIWDDPTQTIFVAYADGRPASSGRLALPPGRSFAGLYGGGTVPELRHRGIYRALVAARATVARQRGYRYLTVDARETSRPILERLGFEALTTTRPWVLRAPAAPPA